MGRHEKKRTDSSLCSCRYVYQKKKQQIGNERVRVEQPLAKDSVPEEGQQFQHAHTKEQRLRGKTSISDEERKARTGFGVGCRLKGSDREIRNSDAGTRNNGTVILSMILSLRARAFEGAKQDRKRGAYWTGKVFVRREINLKVQKEGQAWQYVLLRLT